MRTFLLIILLFLALDHGLARAAFVDNGDGTVTDTVTCLQWQKATMDTRNGAGPDAYTWQEALAASEGLSLAGHADWRLPDRNELRSLVDYSRYNPAIDPVFAATTLPYYYWSSTTYAEGGSAWRVSFKYGDVYDGNTWSFVRAVRGGQCGGFGTLDLADAVRILQMLAGITPAAPVGTVGDVNNDQRLGLAEVIEVLNQLAQ